MNETSLPRDPFSEALRAFEGNPGATRADSTINLSDFLGRATTWVVTTFRANGRDTVLLQRVDASGASMREVLPPEVTAAITRHRSSASSQNRRRGAVQALATKKAKGVRVGNPEALRKARRGHR